MTTTLCEECALELTFEAGICTIAFVIGAGMATACFGKKNLKPKIKLNKTKKHCIGIPLGIKRGDIIEGIIIYSLLFSLK